MDCENRIYADLSDHIVVFIEIDMAMNSEEINVKPKIEFASFYEKINGLNVDNIVSRSDFIGRPGQGRSDLEAEIFEESEVHSQVLLE